MTAQRRRLPHEWRLDAVRRAVTHILIHSRGCELQKNSYKSGLLEKQSTKHLKSRRYLKPTMLSKPVASFIRASA
jgi:hypothetical protein